MIVFPNAKINLGLRILNRRNDGYHNIQSIMVPVKLCDVLEVVKSAHAEDHFSLSGLPVEGASEDNLCIKALGLLRKDFAIPAVEIYLHKCIPTGAGLGGGSSDAAFMLRLLNSKFQLKLSHDRLLSYAAKLGSDCPFFMHSKPMIASSKGEILSDTDLQLHDVFILIVKPEVSMNTAEAYSLIKPSEVSTEVISNLSNRNTWRNTIKNAFEPFVFNRYPELEKIKEKLYSLGAFYASMSGSGSAIYGLFDSQPAPENEFASSRVWIVKTL